MMQSLDIFAFFSSHGHLAIVYLKWATSWQNHQNGMCAQQRLRSAWASAQSEQSSLSAWRKFGSLATHWANREDSDQTGRMPRLIWVFAGRTCHFVGFVTRRLKWGCLSRIPIFSSPEPKVHRWAYSTARHPLSIFVCQHFKRFLPKDFLQLGGLYP